jgi:hypothetical protein
MRKRLYSLDELDDIPGTKIFNAMRSRQAYHLHKFCVSLMNAANREAFRADEGAYLDRFRMSPEQKQAVRDRDFQPVDRARWQHLFPGEALQHRWLEYAEGGRFDDRHDARRVRRDDACGRSAHQRESVHSR